MEEGTSMEEEFPVDELNQSVSELIEKYNIEKKHSEKLHEALNKCQDDCRDLELKLVAEKALRDQEIKNTTTALEKNTIQFNSQLYSLKCEVETWKQKAEATTKETQLLKEQLKLVELEKWDVSRKLSDITEKGLAYTNFRKSFDIYTRRIRDTIQELTKQLQECQSAQRETVHILDNYKHEVDVYNVHIKSFHAQKSDNILEQKVAELEKSMENNTEIKDLLMDKLTVVGIQLAEFRAKNMQLIDENRLLTKKVDQLNHFRVIGQSLSKEQWAEQMNQLDTAKSCLIEVNDKARKAIIELDAPVKIEN